MIRICSQSRNTRCDAEAHASPSQSIMHTLTHTLTQNYVQFSIANPSTKQSEENLHSNGRTLAQACKMMQIQKQNMQA